MDLDFGSLAGATGPATSTWKRPARALRIRGALRNRGSRPASCVAVLRAASSAKSSGRIFWNAGRRHVPDHPRRALPDQHPANRARRRCRHPSAGYLPGDVEKLNLHPDLKKLVTSTNGLILVSGATGMANPRRWRR